MHALSLLFSSSAKFETLRLLSQRSSPLPLRHIAELTDLPIRSVEIAVSALCKQKVLRRQRVGRRVMVSFNEQHGSASLVQNIFELVNRSSPLSQSNRDAKAKTILHFIDSTRSLLGQAKR
jgi:DNA-binding transcriptional ArsR family regulator